MRDRQVRARRRAARICTYTVAEKGSTVCSDASQAIAYDVREPPSPSTEATIHVLGCGSAVAVDDLTPGEVVLDLGCRASLDPLAGTSEVEGTGPPIGGYLPDGRIQRASGDQRAAGATDVVVRYGFIEGLAVADDSIDWVLSNCVLSLVPDRHRVFAEVARVLKSGGRMRLAGIVAEALSGWARHSQILPLSSVTGAATEQDYETGLRGAGLRHVALYGRYVYDRHELAGLMAADAIPPASARYLADAVVGQVWNVHLSARKPQILGGRPHG